MKLPNWLKIIWWFLLVGFFAYLLYQRYDLIMSGATTATDIVIFLILTALLVIPLFQEVSIFGVSFKQKIDTLKEEFDTQIIGLKSEIHNIQNVNVYTTMPPSDSEIPEIRSISETVLGTVKNKQREKTTAIADITVPEEFSSLSHIRYVIEKELRQIIKMYWLSEDTTYYPKTTLQMLDFLTKIEIIHRNLAFVIKETIAWCNSAVHGEKISEDAIKFVQEIAPEIIEALKAIPEETKTKPKEQI